MQINVSEPVFKYLAAQRGDLGYYKDNYEKFMEIYQSMIETDMQHCLQACPQPKEVLDIGSGIGAVDVAIAKYTNARIHLLDGEDSKPIIYKQDQPYNSRAIVKQFMADNNIELDGYGYMSPGLTYPVKADLIISFRAWCYHFPPHTYLQLVKDSCHPRTRLIVDIRGDRKDWMEIMRTHFHLLGLVAIYKKRKRYLFEVKN